MSTKEKILLSLTAEQRKGIAEIIRNADPEGDYTWDGENSVWEESVSDTLESLALVFELFDPESVLDD